MGTPTKDDVWFCLHLYEQRRETVLRQAREWLFDFTPKSFRDVKNVMEGRAGEDANRWFRQATSYWEMIATLLNSGGMSQDCVDLFTKTTREFFLCWAKIAPYVDQIRAMTRPGAFENLERLCRSLPDYDAALTYFTRMNANIATRKKISARARGSRKRRS